MSNIPVCRKCGKRADQIEEYIDSAYFENMDVADYVREYEGTYNKNTNLFLCTDCYVAEGMPLGKA